MEDNQKIYYYTDYDTFKLILENGTLRFKESTSSNDKLDTVQVFKELEKLIIDELKKEDLKTQIQFIFEMYQNRGCHNNRTSLVACFTHKPDSRLLWDAYTMNRRGREAEKYNGVCIEFSRREIENAMKNDMKQFDFKMLHEIQYGINKIKLFLNKNIDNFSKSVDVLAKEKNQHQDLIEPISIDLFTRKMVLELKKCIVYPTLTLMNDIESYAPFFKHEFWEEEQEIRAVLSAKTKELDKLQISKSGTANYYDLPITSKCINKIILGPQFSEEDALGLEGNENKICYKSLVKEQSIGTGIIRNE